MNSSADNRRGVDPHDESIEPRICQEVTDPESRRNTDVMPSKNELTSMTVSLPTSQKEYIRERAASTGCSTPSEYIRRLIHADQKARHQEDFEMKLLIGLDSPAREMSKKEWSKLREKLQVKLRKKKKAR